VMLLDFSTSLDVCGDTSGRRLETVECRACFSSLGIGPRLVVVLAEELKVFLTLFLALFIFKGSIGLAALFNSSMLVGVNVTIGKNTRKDKTIASPTNMVCRLHLQFQERTRRRRRREAAGSDMCLFSALFR
jgi:hypothetical protein